jgi:hypothetical protein
VSRLRLRLRDLQTHPRETESSTALAHCPSPSMKALSSVVSPSPNESPQEKTKTQDMGNACMDFASLYDFDLIYCVALQPKAQARSLKSIELLLNTPRTDKQSLEARMYSTEWSTFQMASKTHDWKKKDREIEAFRQPETGLRGGFWYKNREILVGRWKESSEGNATTSSSAWERQRRLRVGKTTAPKKASAGGPKTPA